MNKIFYILFFLINPLDIFAQINLVPNSDFEAHDTFCNTGAIFLTPPWQSPSGGSPEYFNSCTTMQPDYSVPQNIWGYQYAHSGSGYAFFGTHVNNPLWPNYREYIQVKLNDSLKENKKYFVKFFVCLADSSSYAVYRTGLYFSDTAISKNITDDSPFSQFTPQIENPVGNFITDKENWTLISGIYIAHEGEQYITIGNFYDDANTDTIYLSDGAISQMKYSGFYIDDVSVTLIDEDTLNKITISNAFTPDGNGKNDVFIAHGKNIKEFHGKIFNRWGMELCKWNDVNGGWDGKYNGNYVSAGVYFYIIEVTYDDGSTENKKGSVEVIR